MAFVIERDSRGWHVHSDRILRVAMALAAELVILDIMAVGTSLHDREIPVSGVSAGSDLVVTDGAFDALFYGVQRVGEDQG
jgi:hypothetical protein